MSEVERAPWTRARDGRLLAGVCAGFARRFDTSPWVVRGLALIAFLASFGLAIIAYVVLAAVLPTDPDRVGSDS